MSTVESPISLSSPILMPVPPPAEELGEFFTNSLQQQFYISPTTQQLIQDDLLESFHEAENSSQLAMLPLSLDIPHDFSTKLKSDGEVLCIDVGGSTIRIALLRVKDDVEISKQASWLLQDDQKFIDPEFFKGIARRAETLLGGLKEIDIGVTWSFPLSDENKIITLGKGFDLDETIKHAPLDELLIHGFREIGIDIRIKAIINDSVAVYLAGLQTDSISLILGTGLNSCIYKNGLINTELGFFGKLHNVTKYDSLIYPYENGELKPFMQNSELLFQPLEFLTSSRYVCELLRLVLCDLLQLNLLPASLSKLVKDPYQLHGQFITLFTESPALQIQNSFNKTHSIHIQLHEIALIKQIINIILTRSAKYVTASILSLDKFINTEQSSRINVSFVGSFLQNCHEYQRKIVQNSEGVIQLKHVEDSSIIGAGIASLLE